MEELKLPERFEEYSEGRKAGFLRMKAAKESGRKVAGYFCTYTPLEVLDAAGMLSVSLCGMSNETIPAAETVLPKNLCPLIKSSYGFAITDKCPYTYWSDLIVGETTCDGKKKMYDLLGQRKRMYVLQIPQGIDRTYSRQLWISEVRRFIDFISSFHPRPHRRNTQGIRGGRRHKERRKAHTHHRMPHRGSVGKSRGRRGTQRRRRRLL